MKRTCGLVSVFTILVNLSCSQAGSRAPALTAAERTAPLEPSAGASAQRDFPAGTYWKDVGNSVPQRLTIDRSGDFEWEMVSCLGTMHMGWGHATWQEETLHLQETSTRPATSGPLLVWHLRIVESADKSYLVEPADVQRCRQLLRRRASDAELSGFFRRATDQWPIADPPAPSE